MLFTLNVEEQQQQQQYKINPFFPHTYRHTHINKHQTTNKQTNNKPKYNHTQHKNKRERDREVEVEQSPCVSPKQQRNIPLPLPIPQDIIFCTFFSAGTRHEREYKPKQNIFEQQKYSLRNHVSFLKTRSCYGGSRK